MKIGIGIMTPRPLRRLSRASWIALLLFGLLLASPFPARAVLGDNAASVLADQARMKGTLYGTDMKTYVIHEIAVSGTVVREYVSPAGIVFGVSWTGQFPPDLQQLLGPYYQEAKQAASQQTSPQRAPMAVDTPGLVLRQTGHPRSFHGIAYVPQLVPNGVQASDIR
jgi:Protein of unknown function (DUF2844)